MMTQKLHWHQMVAPTNEQFLESITEAAFLTLSPPPTLPPHAFMLGVGGRTLIEQRRQGVNREWVGRQPKAC